MRFLKQKIAKSLESKQAQEVLKVKSENMETVSITTCDSEDLKRIEQEPVAINKKIKTLQVANKQPKSQSKAQPKSSYKSCDIKSNKINKNIVRNYARAIINFILTDTALTHMIPLAEEENINIVEFRQYMNKNKEQINSIRSLRDMLLISDKDDAKMTAYKRVFKAICELFIKYFSVNWIYNSKLNDKFEHLQYRFKILRRVRNPELFTHLKNFKNI